MLKLVQEQEIIVLDALFNNCRMDVDKFKILLRAK